MTASTRKEATPQNRGSAVHRDAPGPETGLTYLRILEEVTDSGITRTELSKAVGAAERTVQTWVAGTSKPTGLRAPAAPGRTADRASAQRHLHPRGDPNLARLRNRNLQLRRPIDLLEEGDIDAVLEEAGRISGGM